MKKNKIIITILVVLVIISFIFLLYALNKPYKKIKNEFVSPPFDETVSIGKPMVVNKELKYTKLNIADIYEVYLCGNIKYENNMVDVYITNVSTNTIWIKLRILDEKGNIIGETGLIKPNEYFKSVKINIEIKNKTKVTLKIMGYEKDTYMSVGTAEAKVYINK